MCVKRQLTKCKSVCRTYDDVQYAGADYINELDGVKSFECNVLLKGLAEGDYTTDFVLTMEDGEIKKRGSHKNENCKALRSIQTVLA